MSLMGIDVGTSGCKVVIFSREGRILFSAYREYAFVSPEPGWGQLQSLAVWGRSRRRSPRRRRAAAKG
jgi:xylulokinase